MDAESESAAIHEAADLCDNLAEVFWILIRCDVVHWELRAANTGVAAKPNLQARKG
jgi:hypothetical protein